jgi:signal transduction histidine kinase
VSIFFCIFAAANYYEIFVAMKRISILASIALLLLLCSLVSCDSFEHSSNKIQRQLYLQQERADIITEQLCLALQKNNFDSLHNYIQSVDDILFYVYSGQRLVYWNAAWLSSSSFPMRDIYDQWQYARWHNAQGICKRTRIGDMHILTVIPIKYDYRVTNDNLNNSFIPPFEGDVTTALTSRHGDTDGFCPIYSRSGEFLFSLHRDGVASHRENISIQNFSYQTILASEKHEEDGARSKLLMYYSLTLVLILVLIAYAIYHLIKNHGIRNMNLAGRLQLILTPVMLLALASTFMFSLAHIRQVFIATQQTQLKEKAHYVQLALQGMYFWDMELGKQQRNALSIDLRELSFDFETDIHIYDLNGQLLGSSCPEIFDLGMVSRYLAPEVFFSPTSQTVQYEQLGQVRYLAAYTDFINGSFAKIGYVVIPSFISQTAMNADVEKFVVRLLPLYILLLLVSILIVWLVARGVSSPLTAITTQLKNYRLGERGRHISYFFRDEVGNLIQHYNDMTDALAESTHRLARSEREGAWRTMARQVAHEINNPLTPMKLTLQQLQRHKGTERFDEYFDRSTQLLIEQIETLGHIAKSFSSFAKMPEVNPTQMDVAKKLYDFILLMRNNDAQIPIRYVGPEYGVGVIADAEQITQVFTNIVRNALQAMEGNSNGDIIIILKQVPDSQRIVKGLSEQEQWVEISFSDNGPGISDEVRDKVFVPNFTTKNTGAGLGLAISKNIVEGSGGKITFQTSEKGTTFFVYLKKK